VRLVVLAFRRLRPRGLALDGGRRSFGLLGRGIRLVVSPSAGSAGLCSGTAEAEPNDEINTTTRPHADA